MSKLISVSNDIYAVLTQVKGKESYSKAIQKLISAQSNKDRLLSFIGKGGIDDKKMEKLNPLWRSWSKKYV